MINANESRNIDARDLRFGNWIKDKDTITTYQKVIMIDGEVNVIQCENDINSPLEDYEPIQLTEEILLKIKDIEFFEWNGKKTYSLNEEVVDMGGCGSINAEFMVIEDDGVFMVDDIKVEFLHDLQNIAFYKLGKKELEINL